MEVEVFLLLWIGCVRTCVWTLKCFFVCVCVFISIFLSFLFLFFTVDKVCIDVQVVLLLWIECVLSVCFSVTLDLLESHLCR